MSAAKQLTAYLEKANANAVYNQDYPEADFSMKSY